MIKKSLALLLSCLLIACNNVEPEKVTTDTNTEFAPTGLPTIDKVSEALKADPKNAKLYALRGEAFFKEDLFPRAIEDLEKAISLDSTNKEFYYMLSNAFFDNNQSKPAIKTMEKALSVFPNDELSLLKLSEFNLHTQQYNEALTHADNLLKINAQNSDAQFMRGMIYKEMNDSAQAVETFQNLVENNSDYIDAYIQLGLIFLDKRHPITDKYFENALRIDSTKYDALSGHASYFHEMGYYEKGIKAYKRWIYHFPNDAVPAYNFALLHLNVKENYEEAYNYFHIATKVEPQFGEAYAYKGYCAEKMGKKEEAISLYKSGVNLNESTGLAQDGIDRLYK